MARRRKKKWLKNLGMPSMRLPEFPDIELEADTKKAIFIVFLFVFGLISVLSLFGAAGSLGQYLLRGMELAIGWGKYIFPLVLLVVGYYMYHEDKYELRSANYLGLFVFFIAFQTLLHILVGEEMWATAAQFGEGGGYVGQFFLSVFNGLMGFWASLIIALALLIVSMMLLFDTTLLGLFGPESWFAKIMSPINFVLRKVFERKKKDNNEDEEESSEDENNDDEENDEENDEEDDKKDDDENEDSDDEGEDAEEDEGPSVSSEQEEGLKKTKQNEQTAFFSKKINEQKEVETWWNPTGVKINLSMDLLSNKRGKPTSGDIKNNIELIRYTLEKFGLPVEMGDVSVGPTVTQYTFKPAEGIKVSRITSLSNDLALALASHPIRIEAPIPGKSLVGVEVPNQTKALVGLREIFSNKDYTERKSNLLIALGKDVSGKSWLTDITKMPHLLVAGATNSGKSVCLNTIIISLMYQNNPDDLRFIMVDPKRVELTLYNGIPYLLTPVITDVAKTINALKWCMNEMDRRFDILSLKGKKNIQTYNETAKIKMPYIVFIIDELADLMVAAAKEVEGSIIRLAQMARAVGIHLVLATQRPSVDVITGLIKANMPARIAFSVASGIDSRTILDSLGAEKLLGRGDMLFTTAELSKPKRIQGAYLSELEIKKLVRSIKEQSSGANYIEDVTERQKVKGLAGFGLNGTNGGSDDDDDMLGEAKELIINSNKASASFLQRRLSIGYARAARILDILEQMGVVGPSNGAKPREILISQAQYEAMSDMGVSGVSLHKREEAEAPDEFLETEEDEEEEEEVKGNKVNKIKSQKEKDLGEDKDDEDSDEDEDDEEDEDQNKDDEEKIKSNKDDDLNNNNEEDKEEDLDDDEGLSDDENVERLLNESEQSKPKKDKPIFDKLFSK